MNKGFFIVCEGLDCAGKTTVIKQAIEYLKKDNFPVSYSKGLKSNTLAGKISNIFPTTASLLTELLYLDNAYVKPSLEKGDNIIQDRWYNSVLSHNPENIKDKLLEKTLVPYLSKPDMLIYFSVSLDERIKRLKQKTRTRDHEILWRNPAIIRQKEERYISYYNNFNGSKAVLDTTNASVEESGYRLYEIIKSNITYLSDK